MTASDLMLIFKLADDDTAMLPLSTLQQIDGGSGSVVLTFGGTSAPAEALVNTDVDVITLTTGADEFEACKELVSIIINYLKFNKNEQVYIFSKRS